MLFKRYKTILYIIFLSVFITKKSIADKQIEARINTTISCHDSDYIPKIPNAGYIIDSKEFKLQVMHNGLFVIHGAYHDTWMADIIKQLKGHHEPQEEKVFYEVLKTIPDSATMIELGSFWAYYSMWFNKAIPNAKNYMIEPNKIKLSIGKKHFSLNNMQGLFFNAFIGKNSDQNSVFIDWDNKRYQIPKICVDDFVKENNIDFIHILHSDIQGAEYDMLLGCKETILNKKIGYVFISTHGDNHLKCINFLKNKNFHIVAEHSIEESYSADGLIVARHRDFPGLDFVEISKNQ